MEEPITEEELDNIRIKYLKITMPVILFSIILISLITIFMKDFFNTLPEFLKLIVIAGALALLIIGMIFFIYGVTLPMYIKKGIDVFKKFTSDIKIYPKFAVAKYEDIYLLTQEGTILLFGFTETPQESFEKYKYPLRRMIGSEPVNEFNIPIFKNDQDVVIPTVDGVLAGHAVVYSLPLTRKYGMSNIQVSVFDDPDSIKPTMQKIIAKLKEDVKNYRMPTP